MNWLRRYWRHWSAKVALGLMLPIPVGLTLLYAVSDRSVFEQTAWTKLFAGVGLGLILTSIGSLVVFTFYFMPVIQAGWEERKQWKDSPRKYGRKLANAPFIPAYLIALWIVGLVTLYFWRLLTDYGFADRFGLNRWLATLIPIVFGLLLAGWLSSRLARQRFARTVTLARVCMRCGYDLRASTTSACPECGEPIPATPG